MKNKKYIFNGIDAQDNNVYYIVYKVLLFYNWKFFCNIIVRNKINYLKYVYMCIMHWIAMKIYMKLVKWCCNKL